MASVVCLHFSMQEEDILEHTKRQTSFVYTIRSTCRPFCNIGILRTPPNTYQGAYHTGQLRHHPLASRSGCNSVKSGGPTSKLEHNP
jgi:hypothetical protein